MKKFINGKKINLAEPRLGSKVIFKTDDFFASASRIINPNPPIFKEGVFDKHGKWMDGWETRRRRRKGFDYLIIKLGKPGKIFNVDIDTAHFSGNQPTHASLQACYSNKKKPNNKSRWITILNKKKLDPNKNHNFNIKNKSIFTHIKLNIYPDGGVARLRIFGEIEMKNVNFGSKMINLCSMLNGASIIGCNNEHFGRAENILAPGKGKNMGDGWETKRSRGKNFDWLIIKFGYPGTINKIEIDTHHFKGNYPDSCSVQAAYISKKISNNSIVRKSNKWKLLLNKAKLNANKKHSFNSKTMQKNKINFIRINIYPDGGISRIRAFGKVIK
jgi:allantoicase